VSTIDIGSVVDHEMMTIPGVAFRPFGSAAIACYVLIMYKSSSVQFYYNTVTATVFVFHAV